MAKKDAPPADPKDAAQPAPDTLHLWNKLQPTDPKYTKKFDRAGFKGTAINGTYIAKRLTEAFGPCGIGWKLVLEDERLIDGPIHEVLHVVRGHIDYRLPTESGGWLAEWHSTSPQFGQTKLVQAVKIGTPEQRLSFDEEAPKKSLTDLMSKCASLLGIAADVHLGLYDDNKYVNEVAAQFAPPPTTLNEAQIATMTNVMAAAGLTEKVFCNRYNLAKVGNLQASLYEDALKEVASYAASVKAKREAAVGKAQQPTKQEAADGK